MGSRESGERERGRQRGGRKEGGAEYEKPRGAWAGTRKHGPFRLPRMDFKGLQCKTALMGAWLKEISSMALIRWCTWSLEAAHPCVQELEGIHPVRVDGAWGHSSRCCSWSRERPMTLQGGGGAHWNGDHSRRGRRRGGWALGGGGAGLETLQTGLMGIEICQRIEEGDVEGRNIECAAPQ